jgi:D-3-phosphoglycerate dehydrogenase
MSKEELISSIKEYHGLAVRSATKVTADVLGAASNLKVIGRAGIGVDNIDVDTATKRGIVVMNTPTGNRIATAEHTIALIFALCRQLPQADASLRGGRWEKSKFMGVELNGKTLGIIGLGNVGSAVAKRAKALGMRVLTYDPHITEERARDFGAEPVELSRLLTESDFISFHAPLNSVTRGMIGKKEIAAAKPGVRIINCARGGLVDEGALVEALQSGKVAGAALDVYQTEPLPSDHPILKLNNVVLTPHLGAATVEAQENVAAEVARQMVDFLIDGKIVNAVNRPS